jgi:hypothetical protein
MIESINALRKLSQNENKDSLRIQMWRPLFLDIKEEVTGLKNAE